MGDDRDLQDDDEAGQKQGMDSSAFPRAAAVTGAAAGLVGTGPIPAAFAADDDMPASEVAWDYETDVLVLGTGPAGMACAAAPAGGAE